MSKPQRYRKKPVEIEAMQFLPGDSYAERARTAALHRWVWNNGGKTEVAIEGGLTIQTLEGDMHVSPGDYVIRGVQGEFYPCKPNIFAATYEPAQTPNL
jgi:hypothetical protein